MTWQTPTKEFSLSAKTLLTEANSYLPQLFVAALHYSDYERRSRSDIKIDEPLPKQQRHLYQNRLEKIIARHLQRKEELIELVLTNA